MTLTTPESPLCLISSNSAASAESSYGNEKQDPFKEEEIAAENTTKNKVGRLA